MIANSVMSAAQVFQCNVPHDILLIRMGENTTYWNKAIGQLHTFTIDNCKFVVNKNTVNGERARLGKRNQLYHVAQAVLLYDGRSPPCDHYEASHLCGNALCVNTEHLCWETPWKNVERKLCQDATFASHRTAGFVCPHAPACVAVRRVPVQEVRALAAQLCDATKTPSQLATNAKRRASYAANREAEQARKRKQQVMNRDTARSSAVQAAAEFESNIELDEDSDFAD